MEWRDQGLLLTVRPHGETSAIIEVFTAAHGRHAGVVRGGAGRRMGPVLQPGAELDLVWKARLEEHIGSFTAEPVRSRAAAVLADPPALAALTAVCALLAYALPERDPHPQLHARSVALLDLVAAGGDWQLPYVGWELALLEELGFGLDLGRCAVTGATEGLTLVSPKSGRAVTQAGAGAWADQLLPLPPFLGGAGAVGPGDLGRGLALTGHFLDHHLAPSLGERPLPEARRRLAALLTRGAAGLSGP